MDCGGACANIAVKQVRSGLKKKQRLAPTGGAFHRPTADNATLRRRARLGLSRYESDVREKQSHSSPGTQGRIILTHSHNPKSGAKLRGTRLVLVLGTLGTTAATAATQQPTPPPKAAPAKPAAAPARPAATPAGVPGRGAVVPGRPAGAPAGTAVAPGRPAAAPGMAGRPAVVPRTGPGAAPAPAPAGANRITTNNIGTNRAGSTTRPAGPPTTNMGGAHPVNAVTTNAGTRGLPTAPATGHPSTQVASHQPSPGVHGPGVGPAASHGRGPVVVDRPDHSRIVADRGHGEIGRASCRERV